MKWKILSKEQKSNLSSAQKIEEVVTHLLKNRGLTTKQQKEEFLHPALDMLKQDFFDKKQLRIALDWVKKAIKNKERIIVYSDYDVDGITGAAILWETLDSLGAVVMPYVPHRMNEGYGMSTEGIDNIITQYPDTKLIITVDHGITAVKQTAYAKEKGLDVIITDHHTIGAHIPKADAIIHTTELAGSGVSFVFSRRVQEFFRHSERPKGVEESQTSQPSSGVRSFVVPPQDDKLFNEHLALAALATIGDLVPLVGANRVIAKYGLVALNKTKRLGLLSLIEAAGFLGRKIGTYEVGFVIAPRINASGRLTHALDALRLLCTKNAKRAKELAHLLHSTNLERQVMMADSNTHAKTLVIQNKKLLFIAHESYHEGIIGLVAGRLVEEYYRPAIVISRGEKYSKASARSISGFNIVEAIRSCSDILVNVGGHPMAAGFTVETEKLGLLQERLERYVEDTLMDHLLSKEIRVDMAIPFSWISDELYTTLHNFSPFGIGNPEPTFATFGVKVTDASPVGNEGQHLRLKLQSDSHSFEAIGFGMGSSYTRLATGKPIDVAYTLGKNTWNNQTKLQLKLKDMVIPS